MINKFIYLYSCTVHLFDKARRLIIGLDVIANETPSADLFPDKEPEADLGAYQYVDPTFLDAHLHIFARLCRFEDVL